jgi:hypothetical protein
MKKTKNQKSLLLSTEKVRNLDDRALQQVNGGWWPCDTSTGNCMKTLPTTSQ